MTQKKTLPHISSWIKSFDVTEKQPFAYRQACSFKTRPDTRLSDASPLVIPSKQSCFAGREGRKEKKEKKEEKEIKGKKERRKESEERRKEGEERKKKERKEKRKGIDGAKKEQ